ncbi:MAG: hypothetical protein WD944_04865 [Steroidobacteraceae bacterium]
MQAVVAVRFDETRNGLVALAERRVVAQRTADPAAQFARAHGGCRAIDHAGERVFVAPRETRVELEIPPRRGVQGKRLIARFARKRSQVRERPFLRVAGVL